MSYREIKNLYNPKEYIKDVSVPYNAGVAGVCSFFIPGLGQIIDGEVGRGLLLFAGSAVAGGLTYALAQSTGTEGAAAIAVIGCAGVLALDIWAIFDAVKVAKVKNMYNQDMRKLFTDSNVDIKLSPSLAYVPTGSGMTPSAGLSLRIVF